MRVAESRVNDVLLVKGNVKVWSQQPNPGVHAVVCAPAVAMPSSKNSATSIDDLLIE